MRNQLAAAERKAKKAAAASEAGPSGEPAGRAKKAAGRKKAAAAKTGPEEVDEAGSSFAAPLPPSEAAAPADATAAAADGAPRSLSFSGHGFFRSHFSFYWHANLHSQAFRYCHHLT